MAQTLPGYVPPADGEEEVKEEPKQEEEEKVESKEPAKVEIAQVWLDRLKDELSEADYEKFDNYVKGINDGTVERSFIMQLDGPFDDKAKRSTIHLMFKESPQLFETDTLDLKGVKTIRVWLKAGMSNNKRRKMGILERKPRDKNIPIFLKFSMQKSNTETAQAIHYIAKRLRKQPKAF